MLCYILKDSDSFFSFFIIEETQGTKYMDSDREYTAGDKLYMREAHFVIAIGPGEGRTMSEIAREMNPYTVQKLLLYFPADVITFRLIWYAVPSSLSPPHIELLQTIPKIARKHFTAVS